MEGSHIPSRTTPTESRETLFEDIVVELLSSDVWRVVDAVLPDELYARLAAHLEAIASEPAGGTSMGDDDG